MLTLIERFQILTRQYSHNIHAWLLACCDPAIHVSVPSKIRSERFTRLYGCIEDLLVRVNPIPPALTTFVALVL